MKGEATSGYLAGGGPPVVEYNPPQRSRSGCSRVFSTILTAVGFVSLLATAFFLFEDDLRNLFSQVMEQLNNSTGESDSETPSPTPSSESTPSPAGTSSPSVDSCQYPVLQEVRGAGDHVGVIFLTCPSDEGFLAFTGAAQRWSDIVLGSQLSPVQADGTYDTQSLCSFLTSHIITLGTVDHLIILADLQPIDGVGNTLASAGPCLVGSGSFVPFIGGMRFDEDDIQNMETTGILQDVVTHEMGHVLGIGTLWSRVKQGGGQVQSGEQPLVTDTVFDNSGNLVDANNEPKFLGTNAISEYNGLLGGSSSATFVPVEDGKSNGTPFFDIANGEGRGSIDGHWDKNDFGIELMTFSISAQDPVHPLSTMSLASIEDMGYTVDYTQADAFSLSSRRSGGLRGDGVLSIDLTGDVAVPENGVQTEEALQTLNL